MKIICSIETPIRSNRSVEVLWRGEDQGLIQAWELGRIKASEEPELAERALRNELPELLFKGGFNERLKQVFKYGSLHYLAMWQGLRNESLDILIADEPVLVCNRTGMCVRYTIQSEKYLLQAMTTEDVAELDVISVEQIKYGRFERDNPSNRIL